MTYQTFDIEKTDLAQDPVAFVSGSELTKAHIDAIEIARREGPWSGNPNSVIARLSQILFGVAIAHSLANERLEAIRRFSVRAWFREELYEKDIRPLFDVGFSSNEVWRFLAYIGERRGFIPEVSWPA